MQPENEINAWFREVHTRQPVPGRERIRVGRVFSVQYLVLTYDMRGPGMSVQDHSDTATNVHIEHLDGLVGSSAQNNVWSIVTELAEKHDVKFGSTRALLSFSKDWERVTIQ